MMYSAAKQSIVRTKMLLYILQATNGCQWKGAKTAYQGKGEFI